MSTCLAIHDWEEHSRIDHCPQFLNFWHIMYMYMSCNTWLRAAQQHWSLLTACGTQQPNGRCNSGNGANLQNSPFSLDPFHMTLSMLGYSFAPIGHNKDWLAEQQVLEFRYASFFPNLIVLWDNGIPPGITDSLAPEPEQGDVSRHKVEWLLDSRRRRFPNSVVRYWTWQPGRWIQTERREPWRHSWVRVWGQHSIARSP